MRQSTAPPAHQHHLPRGIEDVWSMTQATLQEALNSDNHVEVVAGAPGQGKSYGIKKMLAANDCDVAYAGGLKEIYEQSEDWAAKFEYEGQLTLPALQRNCESAQDAEYSSIEVERLQAFNVSPAAIHEEVDLPCHKDGDPCNYVQKSNQAKKHADQYQLLTGHYTHLYLPHFTNDRVVVIDESPAQSLVQEFSADADVSPQEAVDPFLANTDAIPYDNLGDLVANRGDSRATEALDTLASFGLQPDDRRVLAEDDGERYHTLAPFLTYALLRTIDLGNGWEWFDTDLFNAGLDFDLYEEYDLDQRIVLARKKGSNFGEEELYVLTPPPLENADKVIALDSFPCEWMWELALGHDVNIRHVLPDRQQKVQYLKHVQELRLVQVETNSPNDSHGEKSYSTASNVTPEKDAAITAYTHARFGKPHVITPKKGLEVHQDQTNLYEDHADEWMQLSKVKSRNTWSGDDRLVVHGCAHPGNDEIEKWCALSGEATELLGGEGVDKVYEGKGQEVYHQRVHNQVAQAIFRVRKEDPEDSGAVVVVNTKAYPEWMKEAIVEEWHLDDTPFNSENRRKALVMLQEEGEMKSSKLTDELGCSRYATKHIREDFEEKGWVTVEEMDTRGNPKKLIWEGIEEEVLVRVADNNYTVGDPNKSSQHHSDDEGPQTAQTVEETASAAATPYSRSYKEIEEEIREESRRDDYDPAAYHEAMQNRWSVAAAVLERAESTAD